MGPKPGIEPHSEARWDRIEESLMERLEALPPQERPGDERGSEGAPRRVLRRGAVVALVSGFAAAAAAAVAVHGGWGARHSTTSRVATEASASHVTIGESSLDLSPESGIAVADDDHATVVTLERGEVAFHVAPREKDRPFLVEAGDVHVRVVGTEFTVRRVGVAAAVSVRRGVVEVREHDELTRLTAGELWPDEAKGAINAAPAPSTPAPPNAIAANPPAPSQPADVVTASHADALAAASPPRSPAHAPRRRVSASQRAAAAAAESAREAEASRNAEPSSDGPPALAVPPSAEASPAAATSSSRSVDVAAPVPPSAQSRYEAAERVERSDPASALRTYLDLGRGSDAWAQNALYAAGRLDADRGARQDAVRLLEEYLRRFPRGSNAQDARALRDSLLRPSP
jgi:hypothetical protein